MEALSVDAIPEGAEWQSRKAKHRKPSHFGSYCQDAELQSKSLQSLVRYFLEVAAALARIEAKTFVDGESAVPEAASFSFEALLQRIHPAESCVKRLSTETPAIYIVFDLV